MWWVDQTLASCSPSWLFLLLMRCLSMCFYFFLTWLLMDLWWLFSIKRFYVRYEVILRFPLNISPEIFNMFSPSLMGLPL